MSSRTLSPSDPRPPYHHLSPGGEEGKCFLPHKEKKRNLLILDGKWEPSRPPWAPRRGECRAYELKRERKKRRVKAVYLFVAQKRTSFWKKRKKGWTEGSGEKD